MTENLDIHVDHETQSIEVYATHGAAALVHEFIENECSDYYRYYKLPQCISPRMARYRYVIACKDEFAKLRVHFGRFL